MTQITHNGIRLQFGGSYLTQPTPDLRFIIKVDTTKDGSASNTMIIPTPGAGYDFTVDWGDGTIEDISGTSPTVSHAYAAGGIKTISITGTFPRIYFNNLGDKLKLLEVMNWGSYGEGITDQSDAFRGCLNNEKIADDWRLNDTILEASYMFSFNSLTSLPDSMTLSALEFNTRMFESNSISSLNNLTLESLINGNGMFRNNYSILVIPEQMTLSNLINGTEMFLRNLITELPSTLNLDKLEFGSTMFYGNDISTISNNISLPKLNNGSVMFLGSTINTEDYSALLIRIEANNINSNVPFHGGDSKYNASAIDARTALETIGWTIVDGGLEV